jgi:hypothetical protein
MRLKQMCQITISWAENLYLQLITANNLFKFSAQDSDLPLLFEPHRTFWQKATITIAGHIQKTTTVHMKVYTYVNGQNQHTCFHSDED